MKFGKSENKRLEIMEKSTAAEKKEIAKRVAAKKKAGNAPKDEKVTKLKTKTEPKEKATDARKIKLLSKENPKREGTESFKRFALYSKCKTVAEFLEAGGTSGDLRHDEQKGYIEVA